MTIDHDKIRELLTELIDLPVDKREERLVEYKSETPEIYTELNSLLPFTAGDRDDTNEDPFIGTKIEHFTII